MNPDKPVIDLGKLRHEAAQLSQPKRFSAGFAVIPMRLGEEGLVEGAGAPGKLDLNGLLTGERLLAEIRAIVKEEIRSLRNEVRKELADGSVREPHG